MSIFSKKMVPDGLVDAVKKVASGEQTDSAGEALNIGDFVQIEDGDYSGREGTISGFASTGMAEVQVVRGRHITIGTDDLLGEAKENPFAKKSDNPFAKKSDKKDKKGKKSKGKDGDDKSSADDKGKSTKDNKVDLNPTVDESEKPRTGLRQISAKRLAMRQRREQRNRISADIKSLDKQEPVGVAREKARQREAERNSR